MRKQITYILLALIASGSQVLAQQQQLQLAQKNTIN